MNTIFYREGESVKRLLKFNVVKFDLQLNTKTDELFNHEALACNEKAFTFRIIVCGSPNLFSFVLNYCLMVGIEEKLHKCLKKATTLSENEQLTDFRVHLGVRNCDNFCFCFIGSCWGLVIA